MFILVVFTQNPLRCSPFPTFRAISGPFVSIWNAPEFTYTESRPRFLGGPKFTPPQVNRTLDQRTRVGLKQTTQAWCEHTLRFNNSLVLCLTEVVAHSSYSSYQLSLYHSGWKSSVRCNFPSLATDSQLYSGQNFDWVVLKRRYSLIYNCSIIALGVCLKPLLCSKPQPLIKVFGRFSNFLSVLFCYAQLWPFVFKDHCSPNWEGKKKFHVSH